MALRLDNKYSITTIIESLNKTSGSLLEENWYLFDYTDEVITAISKTLGVDLGQKYLQYGDIRKILGDTKKS